MLTESALERLARRITHAASSQTYLVIQSLVDHDLRSKAFLAYAYFRWVDDWLDKDAHSVEQRMAFIDRQRTLINLAYQEAQFQARTGNPLPYSEIVSQTGTADSLAKRYPMPREVSTDPLAPEEQFAILLINSDPDLNSGLKSYIDNLMNVMAFDAGRQGRYISSKELDAYSTWLATSVTEAMHYFIGHCCVSPHCAERYQAVTAAHITHMLRDLAEDLQAGYFNIPKEILEANRLDPFNLGHPTYLEWVYSQVELARTYFAGGKRYLAQVENTRCRLAGFAYTARFEGVLNVIERDGYRLRAHYPEIAPLKASLVSLRALLPPALISNRKATHLPKASNLVQASNPPQTANLRHPTLK